MLEFELLLEQNALHRKRRQGGNLELRYGSCWAPNTTHWNFKRCALDHQIYISRIKTNPIKEWSL